MAWRTSLVLHFIEEAKTVGTYSYRIRRMATDYLGTAILVQVIVADWIRTRFFVSIYPRFSFPFRFPTYPFDTRQSKFPPSSITAVFL